MDGKIPEVPHESAGTSVSECKDVAMLTKTRHSAWRIRRILPLQDLPLKFSKHLLAVLTAFPCLRCIINFFNRLLSRTYYRFLVASDNMRKNFLLGHILLFLLPVPVGMAQILIWLYMISYELL
jgi:hypothetical protein